MESGHIYEMLLTGIKVSICAYHEAWVACTRFSEIWPLGGAIQNKHPCVQVSSFVAQKCLAPSLLLASVCYFYLSYTIYFYFYINP